MLIVVLILVLILIIVWRLHGKTPELKGVLHKYFTFITKQVFKIKCCNNCNCCQSTTTIRPDADSEESLNGFNKESAKEYVDAIKKAIKFGESDPIINKILQDSSLKILEVTTGPDTRTPRLIDQLENANNPSGGMNGGLPGTAEAKVEPA